MTEATDAEQSSMQAPKPEKGHEWLKQLVGDWTFEGEAAMGPDSVTKFGGTEQNRSIGDLWFIGEGSGEVPGGGTSTTIATLGYDPAKQRFVGTFIGSMMNNLWVYEGELDEAEKVLTLKTDGPSMAGDGTTGQYRDVIEIVSANERKLTSFYEGPGGEWTQVMTMTYRRK